MTPRRECYVRVHIRIHVEQEREREREREKRVSTAMQRTKKVLEEPWRECNGLYLDSFTRHSPRLCHLPLKVTVNASHSFTSVRRGSSVTEHDTLL